MRSSFLSPFPDGWRRPPFCLQIKRLRAPSAVDDSLSAASEVTSVRVAEVEELHAVEAPVFDWPCPPSIAQGEGE